MQDWAERIAWVLRTYANDNQTELAATLSLSQPAVAGWLQRKSVPSGETLAAILEKYQDINPDYLLLGREPRLRAFAGGDGLVGVRRAVTGIRRLLRELEDELSNEIVRDADVGEALDILRRYGYDIDLRMFGGHQDILSGFKTDL